ncbi:bifunctional serine/threonine-protein kinase/formylglycine-generating enzyme family protein [Luteimonas sp. MC1750]|uniref:bifunctional serine/threonine-protein kinase/formylglycine-generating enzyme family protein n=1 Tax=Luteimonas sp. MC1750 TaxID=2799326 RepID=UPI0018F0E5AB|nr:bifunctional serine/threonine-protein kinase/formylglycine-generating enzyme family protein [Luteimonas sp. MC1750]MBJ6984830.1 protein kinase [Luteimonas sp. MC1750]QQO07075.1 protein kinase [Luteimonas sp. MC1750]
MTHDNPSSTAEPMPEIRGYRLTRVVGIGGMSTIYLGEQLSLGREVAIKVMLPEALSDEVSRRRFENEARTVARLDHPNIVGIHDVGRTRDGLPYYAMPYLPRGHLAQRDLRGDEQAVRGILRSLLSALQYAHARGIVHRDVKAENVLFDDGGRPLLADFGIALRRGYGSRVTTAGLAVGSTAYMPPEQARGEGVDARADLYSVGVLAWEMLVGSLPYNAADALSMAVMHVQDPIPRLPAGLRHWQPFIDRALAKSPARRFADAAQMLDALEHVPARAHGGLRGVLDGLGGRMRAVPPTGWAAVGVLAAGTIAAGMWLDGRDASHAFYRASDGAGQPALVAPGDASGSLLSPQAATPGSPDDAMLRAAPASDAERWLVSAERQLAAGRLTAPAGDNAYTSLLNAWQADAGHLRLGPAIDALIKALGATAERAFARGETDAARTAVMQASQLASRTSRADGDALRGAMAGVGKVVATQVERAAAKYDRAEALDAVEAGKRMGLDAAMLAKLDRRARTIPLPGERLGGNGVDMVLVQQGGMRLGTMRRLVSRNEFAAFADATGREPARCRERASLLRVVAPRNWRSPGFEQKGGDPVVCVSWDDARAYAQWLGQREGQVYRLATSSEWARLPSSGGARRLAEWNVDCSGKCELRVANGSSWRDDSAAPAAREADRGFDDVGFRLVRDLAAD